LIVILIFTLFILFAASRFLDGIPSGCSSTLAVPEQVQEFQALTGQKNLTEAPVRAYVRAGLSQNWGEDQGKQGASSPFQKTKQQQRHRNNSSCYVNNNNVNSDSRS